MNADVLHLRRLWQEAFGDAEEMLDAFFATGFSEQRYNCILADGIPVSALYWFDCTLGSHKLAYIYAVATAESHWGKGLARRLMSDTHAILKSRGYAGAILVPGSEGLVAFYEAMGYSTVTSVTEETCMWGVAPAAMAQISADAYARFRKEYLPSGSVLQEGATLDFLQTQVRFYRGEDFLLAASIVGDTLVAQELLGNTQAFPGILRTLGTPQGRFRTQGNGRCFAMFLPLQADCPVPSYFGLPLD